MSASVATPMAGLPNYDFGSDNMPDYTASDFQDHMELDRSANFDGEHNHHEHDSSGRRQSDARSSSNVPTSEEQKTALGNLLGALIPAQNEPSGDASNFEQANMSQHDTQNQDLTNGNMQLDDTLLYDPSRLPSFDANAANELFANDFSNLDQPQEPPYTPINQDMQETNIMHSRKDSYVSQSSVTRRPATPQQREFEAFARLQFEDGSYYLNTYACELGRDVLAYRAALQKEREEREAQLNGNGQSRSSSGRVSQPSARMRRQMGSQVQGSVVSEQGGFAGIDDAPMRPPKNPEKSMSSQESESSVVKPAEYLINPRTMPSFDYHRSTEMQAKWVAQEENNGEMIDDEQPAAVTSAHLPNPHMCPLIPIHGKPKENQTDAELHKKISRRHVKIYWNFERDRWELKVQGRNGAFCDENFVGYRAIVPLRDGAIIQIAHVVLTFRLPKTAQQQQQLEAQQAQMEIDADEAIPSVEPRPSVSIAGDERRESFIDQKSTPKISLKFTQKVEQTPPELPLGPDGQPIVKRRGPGRPPKDGIMSTRERKEREKAAKLAAMREANGGRTPPPAMRGKLPKSTPPVLEDVKVEMKPEKRKYTKRKGSDEEGNSALDMEGEGDDMEATSDGEPKQKKARTQREKSESPEYPPKESLTAEQLARPPESYAVLLYKILLELYPRALPLKDIYRELKMRYPWYVYEATTEGWQSSIRHNLNSEFGKLFDKGDKEGKGFAWRAIPDAQLPQMEKKRTTQATTQRPRPPPQRPQFQQIPGQGVQWQSNGAFLANGGQQPFINHGPWPQQGQRSGEWQQNGTPPSGLQATAGPSGSRGPYTETPQPGPPQARTQTQAAQLPGNNLPQPPPPAPSAPVSSGLAASNMPCTLDGIEAIKRFEIEMYRQLTVDDGPPEKREFWQAVFASAKKRILHGYPESVRPGGESRAEATIIVHMKSFVEKFANPNFKGFTPRVAQPTASEAGQPQTQSNTPIQAIGPSISLVPAVTGSGSADAVSSEINTPVNGNTNASPVAQQAVKTEDSEKIMNEPQQQQELKGSANVSVQR